MRFVHKKILDIHSNNVYLERWEIRDILFGISLKLHRILLPDHDRCEHTHPWEFYRFILWGGYDELVEGKQITIKPWRLYFCKKDFSHRIMRLHKKVSWSICLCGPKIQEWGFFTKEGFMPWAKFLKFAKTARVLWCRE